MQTYTMDTITQESPTPMAVARIEAKARAKRLSMESVCKAAGVNYSTWWRIKKGKTKPFADTMKAIRAALR